MIQQSKSGLGYLIVDVSKQYTIRHTNTVTLLWTRDQAVAEAHRTNTRDERPCPQRGSNQRSQ